MEGRMVDRFGPVTLLVWALFSIPSLAFATPVIEDDPTSGGSTVWVGVAYSSLIPDYATDQQTGQNEADLVGDDNHPNFYTAFDDAGTASLTDGELGFRIRVAEEENPAGFSHVALVGIEANGDDAIDMFAILDQSGQDQIAIFRPGTGANTSPRTTTVSATGTSYSLILSGANQNYAWQAVTDVSDPSVVDWDLDNLVNAEASRDYFVSFSIDFADLIAEFDAVGITGIDENSLLRYVVGTSTQPNSFNQDLGGPDGCTNCTTTWSALGGFSNPISATGAALPIPEPSSGLLLGLGLAALAARRRSRR
jgi:hypothetical protein